MPSATAPRPRRTVAFRLTSAMASEQGLSLAAIVKELRRPVDLRRSLRPAAVLAIADAAERLRCPKSHASDLLIDRDLLAGLCNGHIPVRFVYALAETATVLLGPSRDELHALARLPSLYSQHALLWFDGTDLVEVGRDHAQALLRTLTYAVEQLRSGLCPLCADAQVHNSRDWLDQRQRQREYPDHVWTWQPNPTAEDDSSVPPCRCVCHLGPVISAATVTEEDIARLLPTDDKLHLRW